MLIYLATIPYAGLRNDLSEAGLALCGQKDPSRTLGKMIN